MSARLLMLVLLAAVPAGGAAQDHAHAAPSQAVPLHDDLGDHHLAVSTTSPEAQAYFDQGLRLHYAFNHAEAIRSYRAALEADPSCAMCAWGVALSAGHNINAPATEEDAQLALSSIRDAGRLADEAERTRAITPLERALIDALSRRYGDDPSIDQTTRDSAYARAMAEVAYAHPDDSDVLTLYGASLMNLTPWNYWDGPWGDRTPREGTDRIVGILELATAANPDNPGACHYYIHLMEAAYPERAIGCAERLASLMPGAGHIVHMPGHIYIRVGRYADAVRANDHAVHSDESMMSDMGIPSLYTGAYYPHNYHFMAFAATMAGMSGKALEASRIVAPKVPLEVARDVYWIQNAVVLPQLTLLTFGRWKEVLAEDLPREELSQAWILAQYTRGVAHAALGDFASARRILERIRAEARAAGGDPAINPIPHIAPEVLAGEIALRSGDAETAVAHFESAVRMEDVLLYDEPPLWYYPVRQSLGRALLEAGRPAEAEAVYREDMHKFRENGWSLFGLRQALEVQGKTAEAEAVEARFRKAWAHADVQLTASRF